MPEVQTFFKGEPRQKASKAGGRARPDEVLRYRCEARIKPGCVGRPDQRHHVRPRSAGGSDEASNTLDVCAACHDYIHSHPTEAYAWGFLKRRA